MTQVDFIIIGAQKCGTTTLASRIAQHPGVCFCRVKEPHFFSRSGDWRLNVARYHRLFTGSNGRLCGEASTSYTFIDEYPRAAAHLHEYNSNLRLIYAMRHPIERIRSHLLHDVLTGRIRLDEAERAVTSDRRYVARSRFAHQLRPYLSRFQDEQVHLVLLEDLVAEPISTLAGVFRFLGLPCDDPGTSVLPPRNVSSVHGHVRRFPARRALRALAVYLPTPLLGAARWVVGHPARPLLYRRANAPLELSHSFQVRLWEELESEVRWVEAYLKRDLRGLWRSPADQAADAP